MQATENQTETQNTYDGLQSRDQPEPSQYESIQAPQDTEILNESAHKNDCGSR